MLAMSWRRVAPPGMRRTERPTVSRDSQTDGADESLIRPVSRSAGRKVFAVAGLRAGQATTAA